MIGCVNVFLTDIYDKSRFLVDEAAVREDVKYLVLMLSGICR
jgi:hypothetical protein